MYVESYLPRYLVTTLYVHIILKFGSHGTETVEFNCGANT